MQQIKSHKTNNVRTLKEKEKKTNTNILSLNYKLSYNKHKKIGPYNSKYIQ